MRISCLYFIGLFFIAACGEPNPRKPVGKNALDFLDKTVLLNKKRVADENKQLQDRINSDTLFNYINSNKGFWYAYITKNESSKKPIKGDLVQFEQEIYALDGTVLYTKEEVGLRSYRVDMEPVIKGLQEGIKLMREGEEVSFVFSSFVAYRTSGDYNKIGVNQPVISNIRIININ